MIAAKLLIVLAIMAGTLSLNSAHGSCVLRIEHKALCVSNFGIRETNSILQRAYETQSTALPSAMFNKAGKA